MLPSCRSISNHAVRPHIALSATAACEVISRLRQRTEGSPPYLAESSSSSYGPTVRFRLLPTSPHDDAVTFSYGAMANSGGDLHPADSTPSRAYSPPAEPVAYLTELWLICCGGAAYGNGFQQFEGLQLFGIGCRIEGKGGFVRGRAWVMAGIAHDGAEVV